MRSSAVTAAGIKFAEAERRIAAIRAEGAAPDWATPAQRDAAESAISKQIGAVADEAMAFQRARVGELELAHAANTARLLQFKDALNRPERFNAVASMAARLSASDQLAIAGLLKETGDGAGAAGLCAVATGEAVEVARGAGTGEARAHLAALLRGKALLAQTLRLTGASPERVLEACAEARSVRLEDGTIKGFSDRELAELLGDES